MNKRAYQLQHEIDRLIDTGRFEQASDLCHKAITRARRNVMPQVEVTAMIGLAAANGYLGKFAFARDYINEAMEASRMMANSELHCDALRQSAILRTMSSFQPIEARDEFRDSLKLAQSLSHEGRIIRVWLGMMEVSRLDEQSLKNAQQLRDAAQGMRSLKLESEALTQLGAVYAEQKQFENALTTYEQALDIKRELGHVVGETVVLGKMGQVYAQNLDTFRKGIDYLHQSLDIARHIKFRFQEFITLYHIGVAHMAQENYAASLTAYEHMIALADVTRHAPYEMFANYAIAGWHYARQSYGEAISYYQHALKLSQLIANPYYEGNLHYMLGENYRSLHDHGTARKNYELARDVYRAIDDYDGIGLTNQAIRRSYFLQLWTAILRLFRLR